MTTKDKILNILRLEGKIDNYRAIDQRLTTRLGAVIHQLAKEGKIELDESRCGYAESTKNWVYYIKEPMITRNHLVKEPDYQEFNNLGFD